MRSVIENENFFGNTKTANFSTQIYDQIQNRLTRPKTKKTYPADCRKIAAVDSNKHDWD